MRVLLISLSCCLVGAGWAEAVEMLSSKIRPLGKVHTIAASNDLSGPGSNVPGLANTYDMSLVEWNWGGRQSSFNGAGITTNGNFPLTEGEAITTNNHVGAAIDLAKGLEAGLLWQFYANGGNRTVGRVFGEELPWDNFDRLGSGVVQEHFSTDLHQLWLKDSEGDLTYHGVFGNLKDLPELTRKETNFLRLGSLVYRPPVTNESFFEKEDRKIETGRHPLRGFDLVVDYPYLDGEHVHAEVFLGRTKPVPVQEIDRDVIGTRWGVDVFDGNIGLSYIRTEGERNPTITGERQTLWAVDSSYQLLSWLDLFGAWGWSEYHRTGRLDGSAWIGGLRVRGPWKTEWRGQYQYLDENYELMGHHKVEHYPTNFHGVQTSLTVPVGLGSVKALLYRLHQLDTNTRTGDTIFGDSFFPALANSKRGDITMYRVGGEYDLAKRRRALPKYSAYLEQAFFRKDAPDTANNDIDKTVTNWNFLISQPLGQGFTVELGYRLVMASGRWQALRFHHRQGIPEIALQYRVKDPAAKEKDQLRVSAMYHRYDFVDSIAASVGNNNYEAHQVLLEVWWVF